MLYHTEQHVMRTATRTQEATQQANTDEQALLQRVIARDEQAFTVLYRRYTPVLQRSLQRLLPQADLVDEVLNDVMLVLWQGAEHFPTTVPLGAWLHGIARHKAFKALRRRDTSMAVSAHAEPAPQTVPGPEALLLESEQETQVSQEFAALSPVDRAFLEKYLYQGFSYQDIAQQTGTPLNTVKARICRARRRLVQRFHTVPAQAA